MADAHQVHAPAARTVNTDITYTAKPTLQYASSVALMTGLAGVVVSATQNALQSHNRGAAGIFTRTGGTIGYFAAMGGTFAFTEAFVANQRQKDDSLNGVAGGCAAGFLAGVRARSLPVAVASCAVLGTAVGVYDYGGARFTSSTGEETQEERRKRFFKQPPPSPYSKPQDSTDSE